MGNHFGDVGILQLISVSKDLWLVKYYLLDLIVINIALDGTINKVSNFQTIIQYIF